jgi:MFS family permease
VTPLLRSAPRIARYTFALQWPGALLTGLAWGVIGLTTFAAKRSLGGAGWTVPALIAVGQMTWMAAPAITPLLRRSDPRRVWRWLGVLGYAPLLLIAFVYVEPVGAQGEGEGWLGLFFVAIFLHYAGSVGYIPHRGAMLRTNYPPAVRGRMYSLMQFLAFFGFVLASKGAGALLDHDPRWLRLLYPVAAVIGFAGFLVQSRIRWRGQGRRSVEAMSTGVWGRWKEGWSATVRILREDRAFRIYESAFMLYGIGFLMSVTLLVLYAEDDLGLSYHQYTWAVGVAYPLAQLVGTIFWGRLVDRIGMVRTTVFAFLGLGLFFALMPLVGTAGALIAGFAFWGLVMSGIEVTWSLGPLHFAPEDKAHMYPAVHFSLVGVRSIFAPFLGYFTMELFGFRLAFLITAVLMVAAAVVVSRSERVS